MQRISRPRLLHPLLVAVLLFAAAGLSDSAKSQNTVDLVGSTVSASSTTLPAFGSTVPACGLTVTGSEPYDLFWFSVDTAGEYTVSVTEPIALTGTTDDTMLFAYLNSFDSANACSNFHGIGNELPGSPMVIQLDASTVYIVVVGGFFGSEDAFELEVAGPPGSNIFVSGLPIERSSLSASVDAKSVSLTWTALSESDIVGFEIQRADGSGLEDVAEPAWKVMAFVESGMESRNEASGGRSYRYEVEGLDIGTYRFRLKQIDRDGATTYTAAVEAVVELQTPFEVSEPFPNPASAGFAVQVAVSTAQRVTATAFDLLGRRVLIALDEQVSPGRSVHIGFDSAALTAGSYFIVIAGESFRETRSVTILR